MTPRPVAGQRLGKHIPAESEHAGSNRITSVTMQCTVDTTIEQEVFSLFSMAPPRDYMSSPVVNQNENENEANPRQPREKDSAEGLL
jgi:hypothetical protein